MSQTQLKFRYQTRDQKLRNYQDVQKSVNNLFAIFEEYGRLEKMMKKLKNQTCW